MVVCYDEPKQQCYYRAVQIKNDFECGHQNQYYVVGFYCIQYMFVYMYCRVDATLQFVHPIFTISCSTGPIMQGLQGQGN